MTDLMNVRFKLIAGYPGCEIPVGSIIDMRSDYLQSVGIHTLNNYPHLFQKLEWWMERKPEEMPQYISIGKSVYPVVEWGPMGDLTSLIISHYGVDERIILDYMDDPKPGTREQFDQYLKTVKP